MNTEKGGEGEGEGEGVKDGERGREEVKEGGGGTLEGGKKGWREN